MSKNKKTSKATSIAKQQPKWLKRLLITGSIVVGLVATGFMLDNWAFQPVPNPTFGVSFSIKQANEYGNDWRANYSALLDDLKFRHFRLMSYWDTIEPARGQFNFDDLDWQISEANKRGAKISLAIGLRQPRWPECHAPSWAHDLSGNDWKQALYAYMELVVKRYKDNPAIESYQLENEALNDWFGECQGTKDPQRLSEEFDLVKQWDPNHPVIMSLSDEHGLPINKPIPDEFGYSLYGIVYNTNFGPPGYVQYPAPVWWHRLRSAVIWLMHHKPQMAHEVQMEPWGPKPTYQMSTKEQNKSMNAHQIGVMADFVRRSGFDRADLWGGEWWYWRKVNGDPSMWEAVRDVLKSQPSY